MAMTQAEYAAALNALPADDWMGRINLAYQAQDMPTYYTDTSADVRPFGGITQQADGSMSGNSGVSYNSNVNPAYASTLGAGPSISGTSWFDKLGSQYKSLLGRDMDSSGASYWRNLDASTNMSDAELQAQFMQGVGAERAGPGANNPIAPPTTMTNGSATPGYGSNSGGNPYLEQISNDIARRSQFGLQQAFNGIRSNAVATGGLGGSRQGVAEGVATGMANDNMLGQLSNLWGSAYNNDQNRGLQARGQDMGFFTQQRGQDLEAVRTGAQVYDLGTQAPWGPLQNYSDILSKYSGYGGSDSGKNDWGSIFGGMYGGWQLGNTWANGGGGSSPYSGNRNQMDMSKPYY